MGIAHNLDVLRVEDGEFSTGQTRMIILRQVFQTDQPSIVVVHVQLLITAQLGHQPTTTTRVIIIIMPIAILHNDNSVGSVSVLLPT